jgi:hypothetical protein
MKTETRKTTNRLLEMIEDHVISPYDAVIMCLKWMSEDDVEEMCKANDIFPEEDEEDED